jgi:hypothetical protein
VCEAPSGLGQRCLGARKSYPTSWLWEGQDRYWLVHLLSISHLVGLSIQLDEPRPYRASTWPSFACVCCEQFCLPTLSPSHVERRSPIALRITLEPIRAMKQVLSTDRPPNSFSLMRFDAVYNQFNSDGSCQVKCQESYAFAIVLGSDCWCSNYAPSDLKQTNQCDDPCPGYQSDWCGSVAAGLYGYIALSIAPSGTIDGGSLSASSTPSSLVRTHPPSTHLEHAS